MTAAWSGWWRPPGRSRPWRASSRSSSMTRSRPAADPVHKQKRLRCSEGLRISACAPHIRGSRCRKGSHDAYGPPFGRRRFGPPEEMPLSDFIEHVPNKPEPLADRQKRWAQESAEAWIAHDAVLQARDEKT